MAYLLFPAVLWYLPGAHPKYNHMLSMVVWASYGLSHNNRVSIPFFAAYMALAMVCGVFHMGHLVISCTFFHIPYGFYAISDGRTSNIMCYLSVAFTCFHYCLYTIPCVFRTISYRLSQQYGVYVISFCLYATEYGVWYSLRVRLLFPVVSVLRLMLYMLPPMFSVLFLVVSMAFCQLHLFPLYLRVHVLLPMLLCSQCLHMQTSNNAFPNTINMLKKRSVTATRALLLNMLKYHQT